MIVSLLLTACAPRATPVPLLSAIPPGTLTALAPTETPIVPTATPRPPTRTPAPRPSLTPTETPTERPTPAPVSIDPAAPRITPFGIGNVLRFAEVQPFTQGVGWGVAQPGLDRDDHLVVSRDGGYQWRDVTPPHPADLDLAAGWGAQFFALNGETAWVVFSDRAAGALPEQAWVWRTVDAGTTWQTSVALDLGDASGFHPLALHFSNAAHGWLLIADAPGQDSTSRRMLSTSDGGLHWITVSRWDANAGEACEVQDVRRVSETDGYLFAACPGALDKQPVLRVTRDGGATWEPQAVPLPEGFPEAFYGRCEAAPEWVTQADLVLRVDCRAQDADALAQYLLRSVPGDARFVVAGLGPARLLDAAFFGPGEALMLVDPRPDRTGDLHLVATDDAGLTTRRQRAVRWLGFIEAAGANQFWAVLSSDVDALYVSLDGGQTWGRTDAVIVE